MDEKHLDFRQSSEDYARIEQAILYLDQHAAEQPELKSVADYLGLSEYHFQRLFSRWVGISPKRFLQYLTKERALAVLAQSDNVMDAAYGTGLSGAGRLHDLFVSCEAVTPGQVKSGGAGLTVQYGFHDTPFGECIIATTERGICGLQFIEAGDHQAAISRLNQRWPRAVLSENAEMTKPFVGNIFSLGEKQISVPIHLHLRGTNFQIKVWEALLSIPEGNLVSYEHVAEKIGNPAAVRAVGQAVAHNPVAVLIPCHRVIRKVGELGGYRWGLPRKKALLVWEAVHTQTAEMV